MDDDAFLHALARVDDLPPPDGELRVGDKLAHFAIGERIGAGSMGSVYEARDEILGRMVAIKVIRRTSDAARERFVHEARVAAAVTHPNLVTVHEIGEDAGRAFIVMERIRGTTLRGVRASGREALAIVRAIASGLAAAHAAGIVHRDLKPDNVMRTSDGAIKILDFGIARRAPDPWLALGTPAPPMTGTGMIVGTPSYMSPEQAAGKTANARSDIYSFGVLAAELVTGTRPAPDTTPRAGALSAVLARCLRADPDARFHDGRELAEALQRTKARSGRVLAVIGIAAVLAAGGAIAWRETHRDTTPAPRPLVADDHVRTANPAARDAYRGAFTSLHDAQIFDAVRGFEHAVELDPSFAAAHLRLGLAKRWFHSQEEGRKSFVIAVQHRGDLDARDRGLLDAAEPAVMRSPYDYAESARRFVALLASYPDDSELMYWLAYAYSELGEHERVRPLLERISTIDPTSAVAWSGRAITAFYLGDLRGAREAAIECRRLAPTQGTCAFELQKILDASGGCDELETVLRAWLIASPDEPRAPHALAELMLATRRPQAAVEEMFAEARARLPAASRAAAKADDDDLVAFANGDFTRTPPAHDLVRDTLDGIDLAFETGHPDVAGKLAEAYVAKSSAYSTDVGTSDADLFGDPTSVILATLARTGRITRDELHRRHGAWVMKLDASIGGIYHRMIWAHAYAEAAATAEDAAEAMTALPRYQPLPATYWFPFVYGRIGRTFVLAGRAADGVPYLERATRRCLDRDPRDFLYLGLAKEALGDTKAACAAFAEVLARWGSAKPASITAAAAREHVAKLGCTP